MAVAAQAAEPGRGCVTGECHPDLASRARLHLPLTDENCAVCHVWDEAATPYEDGPDHCFEYPVDEARLCNGCHSQYTEQKYVHEPVLSGTCTVCHDPHAADYPNLLRVGRDSDVCMQCHKNYYTEGKNVHGPVALGRCTICHDPHQSPRRYRVQATGVELCGSCHENLRHEVAAGTGGHHADIKECWDCHDPHTGETRYRLVQEEPTLCLDCHVSVRRELAELPFKHEPLEKGRCRDCHRPHGGVHRRLLVDSFTDRSRTVFKHSAYALCFDCHESTLVTAPRTVTATQWRDAEINLHYVHVAQDEVGRSCGLCHPAHASPEAKLLADTVPFGDWSFPLTFVNAEGGGTCTSACHQVRSYVRAETTGANKP